MSDSNPPPSRRDLLGGFTNRNEITPQSEADAVEFGPLFHFSSNAMGCEFQILCTADEREALATCVTDGFELIEHLEQQLSIYRDSSELSAVNRLASESEVMLEPELFRLLQLARELCHATERAFDVTATPVSALWKQARHNRTLPIMEEIADVVGRVDGLAVRLDEDRRTIRFEKDDLTIDLGGIGKGFAIDRLGEHLVASGCNNFVIHGGQSSVVASGQRSCRDNRTRVPWQIGLSHPLTPGVRLGTLKLFDQAIGTSGSGRQSFVVDGKRYGHIIDPRTGWPANHFLSVTVIAPSAVLADALATAIFVAGPQNVTRICDHFGIGAILISADDDDRMAVQTVNVEEADLDLVSEVRRSAG